MPPLRDPPPPGALPTGPSPLQPGPADPRFATDHLLADLRGRSIRGAAATLGAQALKFALGLGSTMVLARLLTPADFGLVAMVAPITGFVALFKDLGLSQATVQRAEITQGQISALFWVNAAASATLIAISAALAPAVAWFYGEPRVAWITVAIGATFIFGGLSAQHTALMHRQMRFTAVAAIEVVALAAGILAAIASALAGLGYWALVLMAATNGVTGMVLTWVLSPWRPGAPARSSAVRSMLGFGANLTGFNVVNYFARNLDNVLIGRAWGDALLGLYSKAYSLLLLPVSQINAPMTKVALPALSRLRTEPERYRRFYRRGIGLMVTAGMPLVVFAFAAADNLVLAVLGQQWEGAIDIFRALGPAAFVGTFNVATGWVYLSWGHTGRQLVWGSLVAGVTVASFFVGLPYGPPGVAVAYSIATVLMRWPGVVICFRGTPLRQRDLLAALWRPATTSVAAGGAVILGRAVGLEFENVFAGLVADATTFIAVFAAVWLTLPGGPGAAREVMDLRAAFHSYAPSSDDHTGSGTLT